MPFVRDEPIAVPLISIEVPVTRTPFAPLVPSVKPLAMSRTSVPLVPAVRLTPTACKVAWPPLKAPSCTWAPPW